MKTKNFVIGILIFTLAGVLVFERIGTADSSKAKAPKTAVVNIRKILAASEKNREFEAQLNQEAQQIQEELAALEKDIKAAQDVLKVLKPSSEDYKKRSQELMEKQIRHEAKKQYFQQNFNAKQQRWAEESFKGLLKVVDKVAKAKGYDLVLAKEQFQYPAQSSNELMLMINTTKVLYSSEELDITSDVLEVWNDTPLDF